MDKIGFDNLFISEITVAELKFGAEKSNDPVTNRKVVTELTQKFKHLPIYNALDIFAMEKARLSKAGKLIDDFDLLIGATALHNDMTLVANNYKHFQNISGIQLEDWTQTSSA